MMIDFHTHSFPEKIAIRALDKLSASANMPYYLSGTADALQASMHDAGIRYSVVLPIATSEKQHETINRAAIESNYHWKETGILSFGSVHPDNADYREIIRFIAENGIKGIKLHPVFQNVYMDDIRYLRIIDCACENNLVILTHAGYDISFPDLDYATPAHIKSMLQQVHPDKMILAHMGGWGCWDEVEELLAEENVWLDTSFCLTKVEHCTAEASPWTPDQELLSNAQFRRIVDAIGADRILFGSDSPWSRQSDSVLAIKNSGLDDASIEKILSSNARQLLGFD